MMKWPCFLASFLAASAFAKPAAQNGCPPCVLLSANRPCVADTDLLCQSDVYTRVSLLYWSASERGLEYAYKNTGTQLQPNLKVYQPPSDWEPAVRVLAGFRMPQDHWMFDVSYAFYLQNQVSQAKHTFRGIFGEGLLSTWTSPGAFSQKNIYARWQNVEAKWKFNGQFFDLMLRHDLCYGQALSFQPAFGLKIASLQQRYDVLYQPGNLVTSAAGVDSTLLQSQINMKNNSFNIGPEAAIGTRWSLDQHWNLLGYVSGALMASRFKVVHNELDVSVSTQAQLNSYRFDTNYWTFRPQTGLSLGVQWGDCACSQKSVVYYAFTASYELNYWWKQNMFLRGTTPRNTPAATQGDLMFQGLTFDVLFDF